QVVVERSDLVVRTVKEDIFELDWQIGQVLEQRFQVYLVALGVVELGLYVDRFRHLILEVLPTGLPLVLGDVEAQCADQTGEKSRSETHPLLWIKPQADTYTWM